MRFLEPPNPDINLVGRYIRFKYSKPDCCELPFLRLGRVIQCGEDYILEQLQPEHGIRKIKRQRIICFEILENKID